MKLVSDFKPYTAVYVAYLRGKMGLQGRRSQREVDKDGPFNFLLKHTGTLIAFE